MFRCRLPLKNSSQLPVKDPKVSIFGVQTAWRRLWWPRWGGGSDPRQARPCLGLPEVCVSLSWSVRVGQDPLLASLSHGESFTRREWFIPEFRTFALLSLQSIFISSTSKAVLLGTLVICSLGNSHLACVDHRCLCLQRDPVPSSILSWPGLLWHFIRWELLHPRSCCDRLKFICLFNQFGEIFGSAVWPL